MSIDTKNLIELIIRPCLAECNLGGLQAEQMVAATCAHESVMGTYLAQQNGPALGIFQMETATHDDILKNFLFYSPDLTSSVLMASGLPSYGRLNSPSSHDMVYNLRYAAVMCRLQYYRQKDPLPAAGDFKAQATYWKKYYNTELGRGTEAGFIQNWLKFLSPYYNK